jgi:hypothetical protein
MVSLRRHLRAQFFAAIHFAADHLAGLIGRTTGGGGTSTAKAGGAKKRRRKPLWKPEPFKTPPILTEEEKLARVMAGYEEEAAELFAMGVL